MIRLYTLGSIELQSDSGEQLASVVAQPKRLALLAYLAMARPFGFHRRDRVFAMFWPEQDGAHARDSLNQAIRFLRQVLGSSVIVSRGAEEVGLDRAQFWCDALEFQTAVDSQRPRDAIELYRGELLDGLFVGDSHGFDEWVEGERLRLREQASLAARTVADGEEAAGNVTHALRWGRLAVNLSNGDERSLRRWLGMLARAGDRSGAIRAYEEFARKFREEYDADPSPETRAVVEEIRRDAPKPPTALRPPVLARPARQSVPALEKSPFSSGGVLAHGWYVIAREIGAGGMATVYLARDVRHDRWVVVKVLRPEVALTVGADGFLREIRIAASLQHPHIVPVFDSGAIDGRLYFVMPLVEGETLRARLERGGPLPLGAALRLAREIADALAYAHKQGVAHLDIKPENVLLTGEPGLADSHAMITDFGIARAIARSSAEERLTDTGVVVGSPAYMSPEQAAGETVDGRSDVYSLGCVLYEMLAGKAPFTGPNARAVIASHIFDPVPSVRSVRTTVPREVDRAIATAMSKSPVDRFPSPSDFSAALNVPDPAPARLPSAGGPIGSPPPTRVLSGLGSRRLVDILARGVIVLLLASGGWFEWQRIARSDVDRETLRPAHRGVSYWRVIGSEKRLRDIAEGLTDDFDVDRLSLP